MSDRLTEIIDRSAGIARADRVVAAVRGLMQQTTYARIILCELAWEIREREYWTTVRRVDGTPYDGYHDLMRDVLSRDLKQSALDTLSQLGHGLTDWPETSREWVRQQLVSVGWSRARHFTSPLKTMKGDVAAIANLVSMVEHQPTWRQASRLIASMCGTTKQGGKHHKDACPTCGRVIRNRRLRVEKPVSEVAERLLKEVGA